MKETVTGSLPRKGLMLFARHHHPLWVPRGVTIKETAPSPYLPITLQIASSTRPRPPRIIPSLSTLILPDLTHEKCRLALPIHTRLHLMSGNDLSVPPSLLRFFRPPRSRRRILARVPFLLVLYRSKLVSPVVEGNGIGRSAILVAFNDF